MLSQEENELLTKTGPGTPMGALFRRFWLPALLSSELPAPDAPPIKLRLLSEDLVAFRDSAGRVGLLDRYCPHRGSSLYWGRNEEEGLRCVYHGWKFDVAGRCVDMPNEPAESRFREKVRTVSYPTAERGGVVWVYMGPAELHPELPELEWTRVPESHRYVSKRITACNYLQNVEGEVDSAHVSFLHGRASRDVSRTDNVLSRYEAGDSTPKFTVKKADHGLLIGARRDAGEEGYYWRITPFFLPSYTIVPSAPEQAKLGTLAVPIDDENMIGITVTWHSDRPLNADELDWCTSGDGSHVSLQPGTFSMVQNKGNDYQLDRQKQRTESFTGVRGVRTQDVMVQEDQWGPVTRRWREHLGTTDLAVIALRRLLLKEAMNLQKGIEPPAASNGAAYRVRSVATVLKRDEEFEAGAKDAAGPRVEAPHEENPMTERRAVMLADIRRKAALVAVILVAAVAAACGGGSSSSTSSATPSNSGAATGSPIRIGVITDISAGPYVVTGASLRTAVDMVIDQTNASGGINGHRLEPAYVDAKGDPALALSLAQQLVQQDRVDVLLGAAGSPECLGVQGLAAKLQIVYMAANGCANEQFAAQSCNKYSFRIDPVGKQLNEPAAEYLIKNYGKRWAIMYTDYAFGQSQEAAYKAALEKNGGTEVVKIPVPQGETNVSPYITKIPTDGSVDGVIIGAEPSGLVHDVAGIQQFGINKKLPVAGIGTREQFGGAYPDAVNGAIGAPTIYLSNPVPGNKDSAAFDAAFKAQLAKEGGQLADAFGGLSNATPGQNGYAAYIAVTSLKQGMIDAKFTGKADTAKLISALETLNVPQGPDSPTGPIVMNKSDHQARTAAYLYKINGQTDEIIQTLTPDQIAPIGNCQAS